MNELRRFVVEVEGQAAYNREVDGTWSDAVRAIRAEFGPRYIRRVLLVLPEGRQVDVTRRFVSAGPLGCQSCGCRRFQDGRCVACCLPLHTMEG